MKAKEFDIKKRDPNWRAMQDIRRSGAGGQHRNKKKTAKQGEVKHKGRMAEGDEPDEQYLDKVISDLHKDAFGIRPDREFGREWMSSSYEEKLEIYNNMLKNLHSDMDEGIGGTIAGGVGQFIGNKIDPLAGEIMRAHGEIAGRKAEYTIRKYMHLLQKALKQQLDSGEKKGVEEGYATEKQIMTRIRQIMHDRKLSGTESNAGELHRLKQQLKDLRSRQSVEEGSDWGEPKEILEDVLQTLEREVEWPLTEVMDPKEVRQLLSPIVRAVNDKMMSMEEGRRDYGYDDFGNSLRPGDDEGNTEPPNNFAIYINGKKWKVFKGQGHYADDQYEMAQFRRLQQMASKKSQETGKKWEVVRTGEPATK